jgi:dTDP-glucose 4,6-dehydratase
MVKYVIIGSNSFSGQDFIDLLLNDPDREIIGISRSREKDPFMLRYRGRQDQSRFRFRQFDINRDMAELLAFLDAEEPSYIVNFAAQSEVAPSWEHPEHWFDTNTVGLAKLVNHLRRRSYLKRWLQISSPEAYGNCVGTVTEATPDNPSTPYAASKAAADMLISVFQRQYGFPAVFVRATNVYGARQQLFKIVPRTIIYLRQGRRIQLHGGGVAVKSYIHVRDVSEGELAMLLRGTAGERYHLSPDSGVAVRDVVRTVCEMMGRPFEDSVEMVDERPGQDAAYVIDSSKARIAFAWAPGISFRDGIADSVRWVEANWAVIERAPHEYQHIP